MERSLIYIPYGRDSNGILYFTVFYFEGANSFAFHGYNDNNKGNVIKLPNNQSWNKKTPRWLHDRIDEITNQLYKLAKNNEYINPFKVELVEHKN